MAAQAKEDPAAAIGRLPTGLFLMTSSYEDERAGIVVRSVQPCGIDPPLVCVVVRTGHRIEPLIRDSRCFAVSVLQPEDKLVLRKFDPDAGSIGGPDPFDAIPVDTLKTGCPIIRKTRLALDCEVVRHYDLETDYELFVGQVLAARARDD